MNLSIHITGLTDTQAELCQSTIQTLFEKRVLNIKDGSAKLFFDDLGQLQKISFLRKRRKRQGETLLVYPVRSGKSLAHHDKEGKLLEVEYETEWNRKHDGEVDNAIAESFKNVIITNTPTPTTGESSYMTAHGNNKSFSSHH